MEHFTLLHSNNKDITVEPSVGPVQMGDGCGGGEVGQGHQQGGVGRKGEVGSGRRGEVGVGLGNLPQDHVGVGDHAGLPPHECDKTGGEAE